jgi:hypothetical protein
VPLGSSLFRAQWSHRAQLVVVSGIHHFMVMFQHLVMKRFVSENVSKYLVVPFIHQFTPHPIFQDRLQ